MHITESIFLSLAVGTGFVHSRARTWSSQEPIVTMHAEEDIFPARNLEFLTSEDSVMKDSGGKLGTESSAAPTWHDTTPVPKLQKDDVQFPRSDASLAGTTAISTLTITSTGITYLTVTSWTDSTDSATTDGADHAVLVGSQVDTIISSAIPATTTIGGLVKFDNTTLNTTFSASKTSPTTTEAVLVSATGSNQASGAGKACEMLAIVGSSWQVAIAFAGTVLWCLEMLF